jgi:hypothetical protein
VRRRVAIIAISVGAMLAAPAGLAAASAAPSGIPASNRTIACVGSRILNVSVCVPMVRISDN